MFYLELCDKYDEIYASVFWYYYHERVKDVKPLGFTRRLNDDEEIFAVIMNYYHQYSAQSSLKIKPTKFLKFTASW